MDDSTKSVLMTENRNDWIDFLTTQGAMDIDHATGHVGRFGSTLENIPRTNFVTPLLDMALIRASGDDASSFLHNQLTNDVDHLTESEARLAGYCTPKGRLLATLLMWKSEKSIFLQIPFSLRPTIQKRLQMFVMRAKAILSDESTECAQIALAGDAATTVLSSWFPLMPGSPYAKSESESGTLVRLSDAPSDHTDNFKIIPRYLWITPYSVAKIAWPDLVSALTPTSQATWQLTDIMAGIPSITTATQELFVPQMINFEAIGGVNFRKGCYPGQEIVARTQYLGKFKRRMKLAIVSGALVEAGNEIFSESDPDQACGTVVNVAALNGNETACLVELKLAMLVSSMHVGSISGPRLQFFALPYLLSDADRPELR